MLLRLDAGEEEDDPQVLSLLSLPRDLRVNIPGYGIGKLNEAYTGRRREADKTEVVGDLTGPRHQSRRQHRLHRVRRGRRRGRMRLRRHRPSLLPFERGDLRRRSEVRRDRYRGRLSAALRHPRPSSTSASATTTTTSSAPPASSRSCARPGQKVPRRPGAREKATSSWTSSPGTRLGHRQPDRDARHARALLRACRTLRSAGSSSGADIGGTSYVTASDEQVETARQPVPAATQPAPRPTSHLDGRRRPVRGGGGVGPPEGPGPEAAGGGPSTIRPTDLDARRR